jgi:hypothetical protein
LGNTDISTTGGVSGAGGSILYGAVASVVSGGRALLKKLLKNRNMLVSYAVFNKLVIIHYKKRLDFCCNATICHI